MIPLALIAAGLLIAAAVVYVNQPTDSVESLRFKQSVIVTCKSGRAWRGVLYESDEHTLVLRNAEMIDGQSPMAVDGEVLLSRGDVEFLQRP